MGLEALVRNQYSRLMHSAPALASLALMPLAMMRSLRLRVQNDCIEVSKGNQTIRLSNAHQFYLPTLFKEFDYFYSAVEPEDIGGKKVVDFSVPKLHQVRGFSDQPIQFPSLPEPVETANQYLHLGKLAPGDVVIDLGAYSGLTSILFDREVGPAGRVVAVDADPGNIGCIELNLAAYEQRTGRSVSLLNAAVWKEEGEISFSAEGNMGSSASEIVGTWRGNSITVPAVTLDTVADTYGLTRVDFIKCDIEGAEAVIFDRPQFFKRFRPRLVIEVHKVEGKLTTAQCQAALGQFGYKFREVPQHGSDLPLLECLPDPV